MEVEKTPIDGVLLIKPIVHGDERGYFLETWQENRYKEAGITLPFVQDNRSKSSYGILRGLHYQKKHPQGKLVSVSLGRVFDVAIDIRPESPTFGKWFGVELTEQNAWQLWIPPRLAHGFVVTSEIAHFQYKCTDFYHPEDEESILWCDKDLAIEWPVTDVRLSKKDKTAHSLKYV